MTRSSTPYAHFHLPGLSHMVTHKYIIHTWIYLCVFPSVGRSVQSSDRWSLFTAPGTQSGYKRTFWSQKIDVRSRKMGDSGDSTQFVSESVLFVSTTRPFILKVWHSLMCSHFLFLLIAHVFHLLLISCLFKAVLPAVFVSVYLSILMLLLVCLLWGFGCLLPVWVHV